MAANSSTTGQHSAELDKLLAVPFQIRASGKTLIEIEHNLDVIKTADWVIDLGPEGGHRGGGIIAEGTPEDLVAVAESHTGRFLAHVLDPSLAARKSTSSKASMTSKAERALPPRSDKATKAAAKKAAAKPASKSPAKTAIKTKPRKTPA